MMTYFSFNWSISVWEYLEECYPFHIMFTKSQREGLLIILLLSKRLILSAAWVIPLQDWWWWCYSKLLLLSSCWLFYLYKVFFSLTVTNESEIVHFLFCKLWKFNFYKSIIGFSLYYSLGNGESSPVDHPDSFTA